MVKVAEFIAEYLHKHGITDIFMLSGGGAIHLDEAVAKHPNIREVCIKNEATGPMMAEAYARVKDNFGVVYVTTGPGGANAVTGVVECFVDSSPVLIISGQAPKNQTTRLAGIPNLRSYGIQELNIIEVVKPITKYANMVTDPKSIKHELEKAISIAKRGRPGPVWLDIPLDVQSALVDEDKLYSYVSYESSTTLSENLELIDKKVSELFDDLKGAKKPLILAGQGIKNSKSENLLLNVADRLNAPIIFSRLGLDAIPFSVEHNMGIGGMRGQRYNKDIMRNSDLVIALGTSLSVAFVGDKLSFINPNAKVHMVDIDQSEISKVSSRIDSVVLSDVNDFLSRFIGRFDSSKVFRDNEKFIDRWWLEVCLGLKNSGNGRILAPAKNPIDIYYMTKKIDDASTERDIFVDDAGSIYYVAGQTLTFSLGQKEITSGAYASMGLAIPLSIGSAIANPNARILAMTGDGSLETNVQELKTLSYYNLNVKLFVINNGGYISMRDHGRHTDDERSAMLNLKKVADAYDMPYFRIDDYKQLDKLNEIDLFVNDGPAFFEVMCDDNQTLIIP